MRSLVLALLIVPLLGCMRDTEKPEPFRTQDFGAGFESSEPGVRISLQDEEGRRAANFRLSANSLRVFDGSMIRFGRTRIEREGLSLRGRDGRVLCSIDVDLAEVWASCEAPSRSPMIHALRGDGDQGSYWADDVLIATWFRDDGALVWERRDQDDHLALPPLAFRATFNDDESRIEVSGSRGDPVLFFSPIRAAMDQPSIAMALILVGLSGYLGESDSMEEMDTLLLASGLSWALERAGSPRAQSQSD